jgi:hypothetical protein
MAIETDTFIVTEVNGDSEYALHSDDDAGHLTFDYAVWVDTGGRENRLGFYSNGEMTYSLAFSTINISDEMLDEILLE